MAKWKLSDARLSTRAEHIFENIVLTGSLVLRRFGRDRAGEIAAHRFLDNERVLHKDIIDTLSLRTFEACHKRRIIVVQDTTEINFAGRDASRKGLGMAGGDKSVGFFIHPLIAVDQDTSSVVGLIDAKIWTRSCEVTPPRKQLAFADKETVRWLRGLESARERLSEAEEIVVVGDRESDIYSVFARKPAGLEVVVRASHNRRLKQKRHLFEISEELENFGQMTVDVSAKPGQSARKATVSLKAGQVILPKPEDNIEQDEPEQIVINFIEAIEEDVPKGTTAINWRLLTTLPVCGKSEVIRIIETYRLRWRIEEVFRVLKTDGLDFEATQIETAERLFKLAALGIAAATRLVQLVDARDRSERPATDIIDPELIEPVEVIGKTLEGKTGRQKNKHPKGSLSWLAWIVARLGGWNCYYKPPGPKTMAIGWKQLATMLGGFIIATGDQNV